VVRHSLDNGNGRIDERDRVLLETLIKRLRNFNFSIHGRTVQNKKCHVNRIPVYPYSCGYSLLAFLKSLMRLMCHICFLNLKFLPMRVQVLNQVTNNTLPNSWSLWLQYCRYIYDNGTLEMGYRFINRRQDGSLQPARGQARLPSLAQAEALMAMARAEGWGNNAA